MNLSVSELQSYEALYKHQGARIQFRCDQVTYQGIIDAILPDIRQIKLRHTKILEGDHYMGNLRFRFSNLTSFKVVESSESVNRYPRNEYLLNILKNNRPERSAIIAKALYGDKRSDESDDESTDEKSEEEFVLYLPEHLKPRLVKDYAIIDTVSESFHRAIQCIASQQTIGVSFHGQNVSRFGKLTWVCVSTDVCSFLFDIQQLGKEAFDNGLKEMFESKSIKKVIHDCSFPSDCLAHQYSTFLRNVFDTRVADFVISIQRYNEKYKFHSYTSLDSCLRSYLKVPQEFLFQPETCRSNETKRPITNAYLYDLLKSVLYLKLLQEKLFKELLSPFHRAVGFCCTILANSDQQLIDLLGEDLFRPDKIPQCLLMNGIQTARFQKPLEMKSLSLRCMFIQPQTGKVVKPYLTTPAAVENVLLHEQKQKMLAEIKVVDKAHEASKQKKNLLVSNNVAKISTKPYLDSLSALKDALCVNEEKMKALLVERQILNKRQTTTNEKKTFSITNNVSKALSEPIEDFTLEDKSECLSEKLSFRELDEVFHKLVNRNYPDQSGTTVSVKPSVNSIARFDSKKRSLPISNTKLDFFKTMSSKNTDNFDKSSCSDSQSGNISQSSDVWLKLREEVIAEKANSECVYYDGRKIQFVPG